MDAALKDAVAQVTAQMIEAAEAQLQAERADVIRAPAPRPDCDHFWVSMLKGGEPLSVRLCTQCMEPDWDDLRRQLDEALRDALDDAEYERTHRPSGED